MDARRVCADMHPLTPQVRVIASPQSWVEGEAVRQLEAAARLPGMRAAVGLPDLHPGKGAPVGAAFASESVFYPFLVGSDIGCGMGLWDVELPARKAKPERWAARLDLEGAWQGRHGGLPGRAGRGSPAVMRRAWGRWAAATTSPRCSGWRRCTTRTPSPPWGLGADRLLLLVHTGSRGLGESILRAHVDRHGAGGTPGGLAGRADLPRAA
jgi:release factor H-coupled RctB family protein